MKSRMKTLLAFLVCFQLGFSGLVFAKTVIKPDDFSFIGGFRVPGSMTYATGLTHRYIDGQLYFYSLSGTGADKGNLHRFKLPDSLTQTYPFARVSTSINHGDIFQDKIVDTVTNPPNVGVSGGVSMPSGLFWDEHDQRLYWTKVYAYNTNQDTSDAALGYSTLNDSSHTGTGVASWKLSPPKSQGGVGNRWAFSMTHIPRSIANTYLGGRRLGVGFGGGISILSNGPPSMGPALFAIAPPDLATEDHLAYISTPPIQMLSHFADAKWATRPEGEKANDLRGHSGSIGVSSYWFSEDVSDHGVWIDTPDKHGLIAFAHIGSGNADTSVIASPTPTSSVFAVADPGDIRTGDLIRVDTSVARSAPYTWQLAYVLSVENNVITLETAVSGTPTVGGRVVAGDWYDAGAPATSRSAHYWYIYDPDDLVAAATGSVLPGELKPKFNNRVKLFGLDYPFRGTGPGSARPFKFTGATFDSTTNRLYLANRNASFGEMEVRVYQLDAEIAPNLEPPSGLRIK